MGYENIEDWRKAGKIAAQALAFGKDMVKPSVKLLDVAEAVEAKIRELGGEPAFPVNISVNEFAAHQTPKINDETVFSDQLVKLDVGVHVDGAIGDCACTVDLSGKYSKLVEASEKALENAIKIIYSGVTLGEIGKTIQETIKSYGFVPITNLSGHSLGNYEVHAGLTIPNINTEDQNALGEGMIVALEPFATTGKGMIKESSNPEIFQQEKEGNVRSSIARNALKEVREFHQMPFAKRWLKTNGVEFGIRELLKANILKSHPPLPEVSGEMISQAEHTVLITLEGCEVLTKE